MVFGPIIAIFLVCLPTLVESPNGNMKCHMKPFGCHKPPTVAIQEFTTENAPIPEEFFASFVNRSKPAIFRSAVTQSIASRMWTDDYINENFGDMEVRLEAKHEKSHLPPKGVKYLGRDTLSHFIQTYHADDNDVYIVSDLPRTMYKDVGLIPSFGACGQMVHRIVEVDLWWSGGGTSSIIHKDEYNQINCLLNGTKHWRLIDSKYEKFLYKHPEPDYELGGFSEIDPKAINLKKFPDVTNVEWSNFTVHAGDCLFLPKGYYHLVTSSGTHNLAVSILFSRFDRVDSMDFSDCDTDVPDMSNLKSLSDFDVQWQWKGSGTMVMGRQDLEERYRAIFLRCVIEKGHKVDEGGMMEIIKDKFTPEELTMRFGDIHKVFSMMDRNEDGFVSVEEVYGLSQDDLRTIATQIEPFEPSAVYWFEYSVIPFEKVWEALRSCLKKYTVITKNIWLKYYLKLGGTEDFGLEIYQRLRCSNENIISDKVNEDDIWHALDNWAKYWASQYSDLSEKPVRPSSISSLEASDNAEKDGTFIFTHQRMTSLRARETVKEDL